MTQAIHKSMFILILLAATASAQPAADPATRPSGTVEAERHFIVLTVSGRIVSDVAQPLIRGAVVPQILRAHGVPFDPEHVTLEHGPVILQGGPDPHGRPVATFELLVRLPDAPTAPRVASEIADEILDAIRQIVERESVEPRATQIEQLEHQIAHVTPKLERLTAELRQQHDELRRITGRADASPQRIREEIARLEAMRQEGELEQEARAARLEALTESSARLAAELEQRVEGDAVFMELVNIVQVREARLEHVKKMEATGAATPHDTQEALVALAEARARALERRAEAARAAGGDILIAWHREMANLGVDAAELRVRTLRLSERLERLGRASETIDRIQELERQVSPLRGTLDDLQLTLLKTRRELATMQPARVIVQRSEDRTERTPAPPPGPGELIDLGTGEVVPPQR